MNWRTLILYPIFFSLALPCAIAQKYQPRSIQFVGANEYSRAELLQAANLHVEQSYTVAEMSEHGKTLLDSSMFAKLSYTFDGVNLVYHLTPATALWPIRLVNLPLEDGKTLDEHLRATVPLYHGKVPADSGVNDQVRAELEKMLAASGVTATVQSSIITGADSASASFMSYTITDPSIRVGPITVDGKLPVEQDPALRKVLLPLANALFTTTASATQIATTVGDFYRAQGYAEARVAVTLQPVASDANGIVVPLAATVAPGNLYHLGHIALAPGLLLTQQQFDHLADYQPGDLADDKHLRPQLNIIKRAYHDNGYMAAQIKTEPTFDPAQNIVNYKVSVTPGPVYTMGQLTIENASDELRAAMLAAWRMKPGMPFKEIELVRYFAIGDANPTLARVFSAKSYKYNMELHAETRTVDVVLHMEKRP